MTIVIPDYHEPKERIRALPRNVRIILFSLLLLRLQSGDRFTGATYDGLHELLGTASRSSLRKALVLCEELGLVLVRRNENKAQVFLTLSAQSLVDEWLEPARSYTPRD
jgi:hypothetical protein